MWGRKEKACRLGYMEEREWWDLCDERPLHSHVTPTYYAHVLNLNVMPWHCISMVTSLSGLEITSPHQRYG